MSLIVHISTFSPPAWGQRLDKVLSDYQADNWPELSRTAIQHLIRSGNVGIAGEIILTPHFKVNEKTIDIVVTIPPAPPSPLTPEAMNLDIVFEDEALAVINKPAGLVVHPAPGHQTGTLLNGLLAAYPDFQPDSDNGEDPTWAQRPGIVHRLDQYTSGLLLVAKNSLILQRLQAQFADRTISRQYDAFILGHIVPLSGQFMQPIGRDPYNRQKMAVRPLGGKSACTHYTTHMRFGLHTPWATWVKCQLETGRTHQIRVHMMAAGFPLIGDSTYQTPLAKKKQAHLLAELSPELQTHFQKRQALHASAIRFLHPLTQQEHVYEIPLPADLATLVTYLNAFS